MTGKKKSSSSASKKAATSDTSLDELSFEQAFEQAEEIVDQIERGEIGLEASIEAYERGLAMLRRCRTILDQAEQRVEELQQSREDDGE
ncbi:MAG: exodeoxyribonuclease VII small subunit [Planctomycetes bacterium]|nr:exodeoxyribonuclease VII small subunit [Planctomycetota bacterium]NOG54122.1 exodeoxyribonuclease VII small subunit [Planctomycetota bacterium]